jgi:hypothetical protein
MFKHALDDLPRLVVLVVGDHQLRQRRPLVNRGERAPEAPLRP